MTEDPARDGVNWYAYCNNNPLSYTDPTGLLTFQCGYTFTAGAGSGIVGYVGLALGLSASKGITLGALTSYGGGASMGFGLSLTGGWGLSLNKEVNDLSGLSLVTGGSLGEGVALGGDVSSSLTGALPTVFIDGGASLGSPAEGHAFMTNTNVFAINPKSIINGIKSVISLVVNTISNGNVNNGSSEENNE